MALDTEKLTFELEVDSSGAITGLKKVENALDDVGIASKKAAKDQKKYSDSLTDMATKAIAANQAVELLIKSYNALKNVVTPVIKQFTTFEQSLVSVGKTTNLSGKELEKFGQDMISLSKTIPVTSTELLGIAEVAGQLGVSGVADLTKFTDTISKITFATNLAADEAATAFARILKLTNEPIDNIDNLASAVVSLGNSFETSEREIVNVANEIARATTQFNVSSAEIAGLATALASLGQQGQLAGSVIGKTLRTINSAINESGEKFQFLQKELGMSAEALEKAFADAPVEVLVKFLERVEASGSKADKVLEQLGLTGDEVNKVLPALASTLQELKKALDQSQTAFERALALNEEAAKAFATTGSELKQLSNSFAALLIQIGQKLNPVVLQITKSLKTFLEAVQQIDVNVEQLRTSLAALAGVFVYFGGIAALKAAAVVAAIVALDVAVNNIAPSLDFLILKFEKIFLQIKTSVQEVQNVLQDTTKDIEDFFSSVTFSGPTQLSQQLAKEIEERAKSIERDEARIKKLQEGIDDLDFNSGFILDQVDQLQEKMADITEDFKKQDEFATDLVKKGQDRNREAKNLEDTTRQIVNLTEREKDLLGSLESINIDLTTDIEDRLAAEKGIVGTIQLQAKRLSASIAQYDVLAGKLTAIGKIKEADLATEITGREALRFQLETIKAIRDLNKEVKDDVIDIGKEYGFTTKILETNSELLTKEIQSYKKIVDFLRKIVKDQGILTAKGELLEFSSKSLKLVDNTIASVQELIKMLQKAAEEETSFAERWASRIGNVINGVITGLDKALAPFQPTLIGLLQGEKPITFGEFDEGQVKALERLLNRVPKVFSEASNLLKEGLEDPTKSLGNVFRFGGIAIEQAMESFTDIDKVLTGGKIGKGIDSAFSKVFGKFDKVIGDNLKDFLNMFDAVSDKAASNFLSFFNQEPKRTQKQASGLGDQLGRLNLSEAFANIDWGDLFKKGFEFAADGLDAISSAIGTGVNIWLSLVDAIANFSKDIVDNLLKLPEQIAEGTKQIVRLFEKLPEIITDVNDALLQSLPNIINAIMQEAWVEAANAAVMKLMDQLPGIMTMIISQLPKMIRAVAAAIPDLITKAFQAVGSIVADIFDALVTIIEDMADQLPVLIERFIEGFIEAIDRIVIAFIDTFITKGGAVKIAVAIEKSTLNIIPSIIKAIIRGIGKGLTTAFNGFEWPVPDIVPFQEEIKKGLDQLGKGAGKVAEEVFALIDIPEERAKKALVDPTEQAKIINEQAKRVVNGLIKMWRDFWKWVTKMWQKSFVEPIQMVFMWFKKFFDEFFKIVGMFVSAMGTFIENIKNMISALWDIIASIGTAIWNAFLTVIEEINRILKPIFDAFTSAANSLGEGIKEFVDGLTEFVEDLPTKVTEAFQGVYDFFDVDLSMDVESAFKPVYDFFNGIPNLFTQAGNNLANGAKSIFEGLTRVFSNLDPTSLGNRLGDAIGAGLNNTIKQPINKLIDIINGMVIPKVDYSISAGRLGSWSGQLFPAIDLIPGNIPRLADGGPIGGSFDGTDNQLIAAMPGEFVLNRSAVASLGQDNVAAMNRTGQIPKSGSTTNNSINIEPGAIVVSQIAGEDSEQLANRIIEMLKERSAAGQTVIFESGVRAS